jgi:sortase A
MRTLARRLGTLLIVAGIGTLLWALAVWQWQDPFTALYTKYKQHELASAYAKRVESFPATRIAATASLSVTKHEISTEARRYRKGSKPGEAIGRIKIPRLGLNMILVNGTDHDSLTKGPGRDLRTYMPGQGQLVYVAGHRTTYLAPFSRIDRLRRGDPVTLELPYATFSYRITVHKVVAATDLAVLKSPGHELLALQACHPRFFATHRYLAYARLVRVQPRTGPAYSVDHAGNLLAAAS